MDPEKLDRFVKQGNVEGVRQLVQFGTPLDGLMDKRSPLMRATLSKKLPMVDALLDMGASVDFKNEEGWTALHHAASKGIVDVVDVLLNAGAELEMKSNTGRTPLAIACRKKQLAFSKELIAKGANASTSDDTGWTLLFQAARSGSLEVVKWLVEDLNADPGLEVRGRSAEKVADNGEIARYLRDAVDNLPTKMSKQPIPREQPTAVPKCDSEKITGCTKCLQELSLVNGSADSDTVPKVRHVKYKVKPRYDVYDTTTDPPGLVLLLIYKKFSDEKYPERNGAEYDAANLTSVFEGMGYKVKTYMDLSWDSTIWRIEEFSTSELLKKVGCSIVVVSSHGGSAMSSFATSDGKDVSVSYLHQCFIQNQSKEVIQMAKIFFFQFCRGKIIPTRETDNVCRAPENIISFFSTSDGFVSYRDPEKGSIFLSVLCKVMAEQAYEDNLDDLFRKVQAQYELKGLGTTPEKQDLGFKKKFYFNPQT